MLASNYGMETAAFLSTKPDLEKQGWPDLEILFAGYLPNSKLGKESGYNEQVCLSLCLCHCLSVIVCSLSPSLHLSVSHVIHAGLPEER